MKYFSTNNIDLQNYLWENWIRPEKEIGITAYYYKSPLLFSLLDSYYIEHQIMKRRY